MGDVIFIHGLNSDHQSAWKGLQSGAYWPEWIVNDFPSLGVYTIDYEVDASGWLSDRRPMPIIDRALNLLALLKANQLGKRPICFITHSMGGLIAKQMYRKSLDEARYNDLASMTKGLVFISTPHTGSNLAAWIEYFGFFLRRTVAIHELQTNEPFLRDLSSWYRSHAPQLGVRTLAFSETRPTRKVMVVDLSSSDPGIPGETAIPLDADHIDICKPERPDSLLYQSISQFLHEVFADSGQPVSIPKADGDNLKGENQRIEDFSSYSSELNRSLAEQFRPTPFYFPLILEPTKNIRQNVPNVNTNESLASILDNHNLIYIQGAAGSGKSSVLSRLAREVFSHKTVPVFLNLKSWTREDSDHLYSLANGRLEDRLDFILSKSIVNMTEERLARFPRGLKRIILADGINEVFGSARPTIVRSLSDWMRVHYAEGASVVVTDRLNSGPNLFDTRWTRYRIQPLTPEVVREQIAQHIEQVLDYDRLSAVDRELLSSPYFLASVLKSGRLALGSAAKAIESFFLDELRLEQNLLLILAAAAFDAITKNRSLTFSKEFVLTRIGEPLLERLTADGILIEDRSARNQRLNSSDVRFHFDHQLKHDYLAALTFARAPELWTGEHFDSLTFRGSSFNSLAMTLQQISSSQEGEKFLTAVYDWNWSGALTCLAEASATGAPPVSKEFEWMLLSILSEKLLDPTIPTRNRARRVFEVFNQPPGSQLRNARNWEDVARVVRSLESGMDAYLEWRQIFLRQSAPTELDVDGIKTSDPIRGWTISNVLRRTPLSETDFRQLRQIFRDSASRTIRWRVAHTLGRFPTAENARLLWEALEADKDEWVRYGAARALIEIAARSKDSSLREEIFARVAQIGPSQPTPVKTEIRRALYNAEVTAGWDQYAVLLLEAISRGLQSGSQVDEYRRSIREFRDGIWRESQE